MRTIITEDGRWHYHAIALTEVTHTRRNLLEHVDRFMTQYRPGLHASRRAAYRMQIGAADGATDHA